MADFRHFRNDCLAAAGYDLSKKGCADNHLRRVARHCLYLVSPPVPPPLHLGSKKGERRAPADAASPREIHVPQCAWSIAFRARASDLSWRHPIMPCALPSPSTSMVAQNHLPSNRPQIAIRSSRSEEHTYELKSLMRISYAVFCLQKKNHKTYITYNIV